MNKYSRESPLPGWFESAMLILAFFAWRENGWTDMTWNLCCAAIHWWLRGYRAHLRAKPFAEWYPMPKWPTIVLWTVRSVWIAMLAAAIAIQFAK